MSKQLIGTLAQLRSVIGFLGEKDQFGWWHSSFFTQGSSAFLSPIFSRTQFLAQCQGVTQAAALVHDDRIGIGNVYHLFRLPEELEQGIHQELQEKQIIENTMPVVSNKEAALAFLRSFSKPINPNTAGPVRIGDFDALRNAQIWQVVAGHYLYSFEVNNQIFPYFTNRP